MSLVDITEAEKCPVCGADWQGDPIPETHREHYGNATHFRRLIAMYDAEKDCTVSWRCPDCKAEFERDPAIVEQVRDKHEPEGSEN